MSRWTWFETGEDMCWYEYDEHVGQADRCNKIKPHDTTGYGTICSSDQLVSVFLTVGVRSPTDPETLIVRRAALAVVFALRVRPPERKPEILTGAFTWVAVRLDVPSGRGDRTWFDVNIDRAQAEELVKRRIYEADTTSE